MKNCYNAVCCLFDAFVKQVKEGDLKERNHGTFTKRYHEPVRALENKKELFYDNVEGFSSLKKDYICVRSHQRHLGQVSHILVGSKDQPTQIPDNTKLYFALQTEGNAKRSFATQQPLTYKQRITITEPIQKNIGAREKRVSLPVKALLFSSQENQGSLSKKRFFLNARRGRVRKEKVLLLQESICQSFKEREHLKDLSQQSWEKFSLSLMGKGQRSFPGQKQKYTSKAVWRGFTNSFMRNGERLRYQKILRKALLAL